MADTPKEIQLRPAGMTITVTPTKARPHDFALLWITDAHSDEDQPAHLLSRADVERLIEAATKALALMTASPALPYNPQGDTR